MGDADIILTHKIVAANLSNERIEDTPDKNHIRILSGVYEICPIPLSFLKHSGIDLAVRG